MSCFRLSPRAGLVSVVPEAKGYVYQHGRLIGNSTLTQLTIGLQAGGQAYSEVIFLKDNAALENFEAG